MITDCCSNIKQQQQQQKQHHKYQPVSSAMYNRISRCRRGGCNKNNAKFGNITTFITFIVVAVLFASQANTATAATDNIITAASRRRITGFVGSCNIHDNRKIMNRKNYLTNNGIKLYVVPPASENDGNGNLFNEFRDFVNKTFQNFNKNNNIFGGEEGQGKSNNNNYNDEAGSFTVVRIPVRSIKNGALRLFLMFYLIGMQNTPDKNSWKADQPLMSCNENSRTSLTSPDDDDDEEEDGVKEV